MELMTRCPACGTAFAASLEQLQLRKGYVRCVACAHIFDGYEAVVPANEAQAPLPPQGAAPAAHAGGPQPQPEAAPVSATPASEHFLGGGAVRDDEQPEYADEPGFRVSDPDDEPPDEQAHGAGAALPVYGESRTAARPAVPGFLAGEVEPRRRSRVAQLFWLVLILAGVLLALAQAAYVYRMQLAVQWPWARPWLELACQRLECEVPYARSPKHLSVSDSSLQRQGQHMVFEAQLRNSLGAAQQWPVLWLELTDVSGAVLSRRYLPPDVYLGSSRPGPAFPGGSEQRIAIALELKAEHVTGYQVGLFFP